MLIVISVVMRVAGLSFFYVHSRTVIWNRVRLAEIVKYRSSTAVMADRRPESFVYMYIQLKSMIA